jgi:arginyl-tRNA synthetase
VLKKAASLSINNDANSLTDDDAFEVLRLLNSFPDRVCEAAEKYEPYLVSRFLVALAQAFNKFYNSNIILSGDEFQSGRLALTDAVRICLQNGLRLLGISSPQKM